MEENKLLKNIDQVLSDNDEGQIGRISEETRNAFERRYLTVLSDLGLGALSPKQTDVKHGNEPWESITKFPILDWRTANQILRRLEDIEAIVRAHQQERGQPTQSTTLF